jgi:hypothetical protein
MIKLIKRLAAANWDCGFSNDWTNEDSQGIFVLIDFSAHRDRWENRRDMIPPTCEVINMGATFFNFSFFVTLDWES